MGSLHVRVLWFYQINVSSIWSHLCCVGKVWFLVPGMKKVLTVVSHLNLNMKPARTTCFCHALLCRVSEWMLNVTEVSSELLLTNSVVQLPSLWCCCHLNWIDEDAIWPERRNDTWACAENALFNPHFSYWQDSSYWTPYTKQRHSWQRQWRARRTTVELNWNTGKAPARWDNKAHTTKRTVHDIVGQKPATYMDWWISFL